MVAKVQSSQRFVLLSLFNIWPQLDKRRPLLPKSGRREQSKQSSVWSAPFVLPFPRPLSRWRSRSPARRVNLSRLASVSGVRLEILAGIYALTSSCYPADGDLSVSGSFFFFVLSRLLSDHESLLLALPNPQPHPSPTHPHWPRWENKTSSRYACLWRLLFESHRPSSGDLLLYFALLFSACATLMQFYTLILFFYTFTLLFS